MDNSTECAYPILETETGINFHPGLTKRETFAMAAMQGLLSTERGCNQRNMLIAERAAGIADALLKELS